MAIPNSTDYYGDQTRWFIGTVLNVNDPLKLGRVQVRIYGVHTGNDIDIPLSDLPWAQVVVPVTEGGSSGIGTNVGIKVKAQVYGIFLDGSHSQLPLVLGSIPKIEENTVNLNPEDIEKNQGVSTAEDKFTPTILPELEGSTNIERAYNFFLANGYTPEQSAGIVGNLIQESKKAGNSEVSGSIKDKQGNVVDIDPTATNPTNGAYGIAQWNPNNKQENRKNELIKFTEENNTRYNFPYTYDTLLAQLNFIKYELNTKGYLGNAKLLQADTVADAAKIFEKDYERPESGSTEDRIFFAETVHEVMNRDDV